MKKLLLLSAVLFVYLSVFAQQPSSTYLWPIKDAKAGENIIYAPQSYIGTELNFGSLFIGAPEGTTIVSPVDGIIQHFAISYLESLNYSISYGVDGSFDEALAKLKGELDKSKDPKYLSGALSIKCADGNTIYISGLTGDLKFKTGQKITRGEPVGKVAYCYYKIKEPAIDISISKNSKAADPMSPFGLKSSFIPPSEIKPVTSLTKEQATEDFMIYIDALKEAYPGLYNVVTTEELQQYVDKTLSDINAFSEDLSFDHFRYIIRGAVAKIHDSHIYLHSPIWEDDRSRPPYQPKIWFGWINDTLICSNVVKEYERFFGKQIISVNGLSADTIKKIISAQTTSYDAKVEQYNNYRLATQGFGSLFRKPYGNNNFDMLVEFASGEKVDIKGASTKSGMPKYIYNMRDFFATNWNQEQFALRVLNDSTAYIGLTSFQLNQVQVEEIATFIDSISDKKHLIIDVRNNGGGHVEVLQQLYTYIAGDPMMLNGYSKVNKQGHFKSFKYSINYTDFTDIFPEYEQRDGMEGYYSNSDLENNIKPDSVINYKGKIYVLANENSISAATIFPALVVRNHRGVVVGRETRTAYHFMNALKFSDMRLPNSSITITIPLAELYFDTIVNDRVPFGRGVLPDYYVPITLDELTSQNGDAILNYTLKLIENGEYIKGDNPFSTNEADQSKSKISNTLLIGGGILVIAIVAFFLIRNNRNRKKQRNII